MRWRRVGAVLGSLVVLGVVTPAGSAVAAPNDPMTPKEVRASQWWLDELGVTKAQKVTRGAGVRVCVIDGGVDPSLPALGGIRFADGGDFSGGEGAADGLAVTRGSHGVAMVSLIAGRGVGPGRSQGVLGVAPEVTVLSMSTSLDSVPQAEQAERGEDPALVECVNRGAGVVNMSFGGGLDDRAVAYAQAHDVVLVGGAGNSGESKGPAEPANMFGVIAVSGVDATLQRAESSNYGGPTFRVPWRSFELDTQGVAVAGPFAVDGRAGAGVSRQCRVGYGLPDLSGGYRESCGGTSGATAVVSGVVALVRAAHPELNAANVVNRILVTAKKPKGGVPDPEVGFGVVDAKAAVSAEVPLVEANPLGSIARFSMGVWDPKVVPTGEESVAGQDPPSLTPQEVMSGPQPWEGFDATSRADFEARPVPGQAEVASDGGLSVPLVLLVGGLAIVLVIVGAVLLNARREGESVQPIEEVNDE